jgi:hypothetical protein
MTQRSRGTTALNPLFNILASVMLVFSVVCLCGVLAVFAMPGLVPAQFQPVTEVAEVAVPSEVTPTPTPKPTLTTAASSPDVPTFPATWTPTTPTLTPTRPTSTPTTEPPTINPLNTRTPTNTATTTATATKTLTPGPPTKTLSPLPYTLQTGSPAYLRNYVNTAACKWMGIVGQAFGLDGKPQLNLYVRLEGGGLSLEGVTGSQPAIGPGAYQIVLGDHPVDTTDTYRVQLRNASGQPISDTYIIPTKGDCNSNLVLVNFAQNH